MMSRGSVKCALLVLLLSVILQLGDSKQVCSSAKKGSKAVGELMSKSDSKSPGRCRDTCRKSKQDCVAWHFQAWKKTGSCKLYSYGSLKKAGKKDSVAGTCSVDAKAPPFEIGGGVEDGIVFDGDDCIIKINGKCPKCPGNQFDYLSDTKCTCADGSSCA